MKPLRIALFIYISMGEKCAIREWLYLNESLILYLFLFFFFPCLWASRPRFLPSFGSFIRTLLPTSAPSCPQFNVSAVGFNPFSNRPRLAPFSRRRREIRNLLGLVISSGLFHFFFLSGICFSDFAASSHTWCYERQAGRPASCRLARESLSCGSQEVEEEEEDLNEWNKRTESVDVTT